MSIYAQIRLPYTPPMNPKDEEESFSELELSPVPRPLEINTVPPFLSKTFDIVDDAAIDAIVSWSSAGASFVVWDPAEFSRLVLPRSFKHNNFSSFVRQLNTYGFRKVDADRWEFANEAFLRGNKQLLKNIQRRRPTQSQQASPETAALSPELGTEVEKLMWERSALMQEVLELQQQQRGTARLVDGVNRRLRSAEHKQKQMVSFFSKMVQNPDFLSKLKQKAERKGIASSQRPHRKFVTHQLHHQQREIPELEFSHEGQSMDHIDLDKGKGIMSSPMQEFEIGLEPEYCLSFPDQNLMCERVFPELSSKPMENTMIKEEDIWDLGLDPSAGMSSGGNEFVGDQVSYEGVDLETMSEMSDIWDLDSYQIGGESSETEKWPSDGSPFGL